MYAISSKSGITSEAVESTSRVWVDAESRSVIIDGQLKISSPEVVAHVGAAPDAQAALLSAVEVGASVLIRASTTLDTEWVSQRLGSLTSTMQSSILDFVRQMSDPLEAGTAANRIGKLFEGEATRLKEVIAAGTATVQGLDLKLQAFQQGTETLLRDAIAKNLGSADNGIGTLLKVLQDELKSIREAMVLSQIDRAKTTASSYKKGDEFEQAILDELYSFVQKIQSVAGIEIAVHDVRKVTGQIGKQGDFVLELIGNTPKRIAIEVKDQQGVSMPQLLDVLKQSRQNRAADLAIFIGPEVGCLPREVGGFGMFGDSAMIATINSLDICLKLSVSRLLYKQTDSDKVFDRESAAKLIEDIQTAARRFSSLMTTARATIKAAETTMATASTIRDTIGETATNLLKLLRDEHSGTVAAGAETSATA